MKKKYKTVKRIKLGQYEDDHHIIPRSRGGSNEKGNRQMVDAALHTRYHSLFSNLLPHEIVEWMVDYFWGGNWSLLSKIKNKIP